ncbi:hypothetical protein MGH68_06200 [Erysipelothrix sp. D19-032]
MDRGITKENIRQLFSINRQLIWYQTAINAIGDVTQYINDQKPEQLWSPANASNMPIFGLKSTNLIKISLCTNRLSMRL